MNNLRKFSGNIFPETFSGFPENLSTFSLEQPNINSVRIDSTEFFHHLSA